MNIKIQYCLIVILFISATSCVGRAERIDDSETTGEIENQHSTPVDKLEKKARKVGKAVFYLENSGSMFGYVKGYTEYVTVVSELAYLNRFSEEKTPRQFYFINGGEDLEITNIGNNPTDLNDKLNLNGFNCGDPAKSNLNSMFQLALSRAKHDTISILISDGIYDIGRPQAPMNALSTEGNETKEMFITRLSDGDLQTIIIKLTSQFSGKYFPVTGGIVELSAQERPFYIWIFGETELLDEYFPEEFINSLKGYADMARFLKFDELNIPYQAVSQNILGSFRFDRRDKNILLDVKTDRHGQGFQFSFATDFSALPYSDSYLETTSNYSCSDEDYTVTSVTKINKKIYEITSFTPTHLITVSTQDNPYCELSVSLKDVVPVWIVNTNSDDESNITSDTTQTFGFKFLTKAMSDAYSYKNKEKNITNFTFEIRKKTSSSNTLLITLLILGILALGITLLIKYKR